MKQGAAATPKGPFRSSSAHPTAFTLTSKKIAYWPEAPKRFNVKVFRPQFIDRLLLTKKNVADRTFFIFRGSGSNFTVEIRN